MTHHDTAHPLPRAALGVLAIAFLAALLLLQSCKRADGMATWTPVSPTPVAYLEDSVLTSRVKAALLLSPVVRSINIGVESHQGVVLLSGMVADPTQLDLAMFVALNVPGVTQVNSFMFSAGFSPAHDSASSTHSGPSTDSAVPLLQLPQHPRDQSHTPHPLPPTSAGPRTVERATSVGMDNAQPMDHPSTFRRWMGLTSRVLGISSIHDELQIKQ